MYDVERGILSVGEGRCEVLVSSKLPIVSAKVQKESAAKPLHVISACSNKGT